MPYKEMPTVLQLLASQIKGNYERISTWSGAIEAKLIWIHTGPSAEEIFTIIADAQEKRPRAILQMAEDVITFAVDAKKDFVYVDTLRQKPSDYWDYDAGTRLDNSRSHPHWSTRIITPDSLLDATPQSVRRNEIIQRKATKEMPSRTKPTGLYAYDIAGDPRRAFFAGAEFTWDNLDSLLQRIKEFGKVEFDGYKLTMTREQKGNVTEYRIVQPGVVSPERSSPEHYALVTKVFSSQSGFNMTYFEVASGSGRKAQEFTWEYESVNGVHVPKKVTQVYYALDGSLSSRHEYTYTQNKVNEPIPPETFDISNLHLKDGEEVVDKITRNVYRYESTTQTLKPVSK